jgi:UDP-glucose 4-epimerase
MKICITGGAGFIGSHLTDLLIEKGNDVVVIDNLSLGTLDNLSNHKESRRFKFIKGDINDGPLVAKLFEKEDIEMVFHLVANSDISKSHDDPDVDYKNTFLSTYSLLKTMKASGVRKLAFASTSAIYGETTSELHENFGPLLPVSHYGASKLSSEAFISSFVSNYGFQAWIVRFPNVVGERATHGVIFDFINKIRKNPDELVVLGDGNQNKPYLYVKDLVEALYYIWQNSTEQINVFNAGVLSRTKVSTIAEMVIAEMGKGTKIKYMGGDRGWIGDVPSFNYNLDKVHKLGWHAKLSSDESVKKAIRYILGKS